MIQELSLNTFIAMDGNKKMVFDVDSETYNKYCGNNAREICKGSDDELVYDKIYSGTKTTYTLKHHLNILGVPIFFIEKIETEPVKYEAKKINFSERTVTC